MKYLGCLCVIALLCGCAPSPPPADLHARLQHEDPTVRAAAAVEAGKTGDASAIPLLVDRLLDPERDVRMMAILSLEKLTGRTMGYRHYGSRAEQSAAVDRWRAWLRAGQPAAWPDSRPATCATSGSASRATEGLP